MAHSGRRRLSMHVALTSLIAAAALLAPERLTYVWISRRPSRFARLVSRVPGLRDAGPIAVVRYLFVGFKLLQAGVFLAWCLNGAERAALLPAPHPIAIVAGALLVGAGQWLNVRAFALLGHDGVFYGTHFGAAVPWRTEFPFSLLSHPQYLGAVLSIWGFFLVVRCPADDWYLLHMIESAYYALGACFEA